MIEFAAGKLPQLFSNGSIGVDHDGGLRRDSIGSGYRRRRNLIPFDRGGLAFWGRNSRGRSGNCSADFRAAHRPDALIRGGGQQEYDNGGRPKQRPEAKARHRRSPAGCDNQVPNEPVISWFQRNL
jgi:hypothetical protein